MNATGIIVNGVYSRRSKKKKKEEKVNDSRDVRGKNYRFTRYLAGFPAEVERRGFAWSGGAVAAHVEPVPIVVVRDGALS